jgi:hypothetical protein
MAAATRRSPKAARCLTWTVVRYNGHSVNADIPPLSQTDVHHEPDVPGSSAEFTERESPSFFPTRLRADG